MEELVVLVDRQNNKIGTASKATVHTKDTPLHRGFSLFLFNRKKQLLLTKRSSKKKTFPGVLTNTVCGHPGPSESVQEAAKRRLKYELGIQIPEDNDTLQVMKKDYIYTCADSSGIVENEICPILVGFSSADPKPNKDEVGDYMWVDFDSVLLDMKKHPSKFSPWSREEAILVDEYLQKNHLKSS